MAKTIRSHPTSPFVLPATPIFSNIGPEMDLPFLHFPTSPKVKRPAPKRNKNAHGPSLHIRFLSKSHFLQVIQNHVLLLGKIHFLQLLSYFDSFVHLRFKYGRPQIIIISKQNSYFKMRTCVCGAFLAGFLFCCFLRVLAQQM